MPVLSVNNLSHYFGGYRALSDICATFAEKQVNGVIGPNGAGKTTWLACLSGVLAPSEGTITLDGKDVAGQPPHVFARLGIARTYQTLRVFPSLTCVENVMVGMHTRTRVDLLPSLLRLPWRLSAQEAQMRKKALEILSRTGLTSQADRLAGDLSLAEQRQLEIARALAADPSILLLDEPTSGMGYGETGAVRDLIRQLAREGLTVILVAHDMDLVMDVTDWIIVINFGEKIAEGPPGQIRSDQRVIDAYLGMEA